MHLLPFVRALHMGATLLLAGTWAFRILLTPADGTDAGMNQVLRRLGAWAMAVALATWICWLAAIAAAMSDLPVLQALSSDVLGAVAMQTTFGRVWVWRAGLLLVLAALQWRGTGSPAFERLAGFMAACALASLAGSGHALGAHPEHLAVDAVHLLAAGMWVGMLPLLWWSIHRAVVTACPADVQLAVRATQRFAGPGATAVIAVGVTGLLNAWWLVGSPGNLLAFPYGLLVLAKMALYIGMVLLAVVNRWVLVPRLAGGTRSPLRILRRTVLAETMAGVLVLAAVSILGVTPPASHEHSGHPMHHEL